MVVFDVDGTLVDTEYIAELAWNAAVVDMALPFPDQIRQSVVGTSQADTDKLLSPYFPDQDTYKAFQAYTDSWFMDWIRANGLPLKFYAKETILMLNEKGIRCAFATSSCRERIRFYSSLCPDLFTLPDFIITGDQVRHGKPDPAIYQKVLAAADLSGSQCLSVEDSPAGITSAFRAGIPVIGIPDRISLAKNIAEKCEEVFVSLKDVCEYLISSRALHRFSRNPIR